MCLQVDPHLMPGIKGGLVSVETPFGDVLLFACLHYSNIIWSLLGGTQVYCILGSITLFSYIHPLWYQKGTFFLLHVTQQKIIRLFQQCRVFFRRRECDEVSSRVGAPADQSRTREAFGNSPNLAELSVNKYGESPCFDQQSLMKSRRPWFCKLWVKI